MNPVSIRVTHTHRTQYSLTSTKAIGSASNANDVTSKSSGSVATTGSESVLRLLDSHSRQRALSGCSKESSALFESDNPVTPDNAGSQVDVEPVSDVAVNAAIAADTSGLNAAKSAMKYNMTELAYDSKAFHSALEKSFGGDYDKVEAETIGQQVLKGDFGWMPKIEVVDESVLQDQSGQQGEGKALAAYSTDNDTIYISQQLLNSDPGKAIEILTEEVGHGLDTRLNTADAAGDEGNIFSRLVGGEDISEAELVELKSENDSGTIIVHGKEMQVEYGLFSGIKKRSKRSSTASRISVTRS